MKVLILTGLIASGASGLTVAADFTDSDRDSQCIYQGQPYTEGSPLNAGGQDLKCVRKSGRMVWLDAAVADNYL